MTPMTNNTQIRNEMIAKMVIFNGRLNNLLASSFAFALFLHDAMINLEMIHIKIIPQRLKIDITEYAETTFNITFAQSFR